MPENNQQVQPVQPMQQEIPVIHSTQSVSEPKKGMSGLVKILIGCGILSVLCIIVFIVLFVLGVLSLPQAAKNVQVATDTQALNNVKNIGDVISLTGENWTVTNAKDLGSVAKSLVSGLKDCTSTSGKLIQVDVKVKNTLKEISTISNASQTLYDSDKNVFTQSQVYARCVNKDSSFTDNFTTVNPGLEDTFNEIFEVPSTSSEFMLKIPDVNSGEYQYVSLGF